MSERFTSTGQKVWVVVCTNREDGSVTAPMAFDRKPTDRDLQALWQSMADEANRDLPDPEDGVEWEDMESDFDYFVADMTVYTPKRPARR